MCGRGCDEIECDIGVWLGAHGTFRLDQSTKHTHTNLHTYAKTYQTTQGNNYISHQTANRPSG